MIAENIYLMEKLKSQGYKLTEQRFAVLEVLNENKGEHLSFDEIFAKVKGKYPLVGIATVYRTINLLDRLDVVYKMFFEDGKIRYELNSEGSHKHHHLICMKCGNVFTLEFEFLDQLERDIRDKKAFQIKDHRVKFYGYCKKCIE